jgi:uncharacterized Ntn-hydrolase superfamily protein
MTFSIVGRDASTGMLGAAVSSSSLCVGARCAHARAGAGAAASQNVTDPSLGKRLLGLLGAGVSADEAMRIVTTDAPFIDYRQLTVVDGRGRTAAWSGADMLGRNAVVHGRGCVAAGNLLAGGEVVEAMVRAFEGSDGERPAERLLRSLEAGLEAGGEEGPVRSCGLIVVDRVSWPVADLRVDCHDAPIVELRRLWVLWEPEMDAYVTRALDPTRAPSFGVPGDDGLPPES